VTPVRETKYTKLSASFLTRFTRARVEVGASIGTSSTPTRPRAWWKGPASSAGTSVSSTPSTPAVAASTAKRESP